MHETLRSSFKLQKENAEWQQITSDFMYGTFYSVFAKFQYEKNSFKPSSCTIKIQNYQGAVSIGLKEVSPEINVILDKTRGINQYVYLLDITVSPLNNIHELTQENIHINYPQNLSTETNKNLSEDIIQKAEFSPNLLMAVRLLYFDYHDETEISSDNFDINTLPFIDTSIYERDGDTIRKKAFESIKRLDIQEDEEDLSSTQEIRRRKNRHYQYDGVYDKNTGNGYLRLRPCRNVYVRFV